MSGLGRAYIWSRLALLNINPSGWGLSVRAAGSGDALKSEAPLSRGLTQFTRALFADLPWQVLDHVALVDQRPHVAHHVVRDDSVRFGAWMNRAAIESCIGRLQNVERRNPLTVCVGREERVV